MKAPILKIIVLFITSVFIQAEASSIKQVMIGSQVQEGFDMGVNSSSGNAKWVINKNGYFQASYPSGETWGAVFITVGKPKNPPRPFTDLSTYKTLLIDMKGASGGERVSVGLKTNTQKDDGTETKLPVILKPDWQTYRFDLDLFDGTDPKRLYVVTEFVFEGKTEKTVMYRNITFKK